MRLSVSALISALLLALSASFVTADESYLTSTSLDSCQQNNSFSASLFDVTFTPNNASIAFHIVGVSTVSGHVTIELVVYAYGLKAYTTYIDPCASGYEGLCPMQAAPLDIDSNRPVDSDSLKKVPCESARLSLELLGSTSD